MTLISAFSPSGMYPIRHPAEEEMTDEDHNVDKFDLLYLKNNKT